MGRPVKAGDSPRRAAFLQRMGRMPGAEYRKGKPTPLLLSLRAWGAGIKLREERNGRANQAAKIGAGKTRQAPHSQAHGLYEKSNEGRQDVQSITQISTEEGRQVMSLYRNMNAKKKAGTSKSKKKSTISSKSYADMKAGFPNSKKNKAKRKAKMKKA